MEITTGLADLLEAEEPAVAEEVQEAAADDGAGQEEEEKGQEQAGVVLDDARIQSVIQAEIARRDAAREAQVAAQARQGYEQSLSHEEYGRYVRQTQEAQAAYNTVATQVATQFYDQAWGQINAYLDKEGIPQDARPDPRHYASYADLVGAVNETVLSKRASSEAEKLAQTRAEAIVAEKMAEVYRQYPKQPTIPGGATAQVLPESASGIDWLRAAEQE
ncbi:MAG: hypothetical protein AB7Q01_08395 [Gammaproteobacteria bacterium]